MVDSIESSLTQVCMLCFEKTATVEKEDGEVIFCKKCKKERAEGNFSTGPDGIVMGGFEEATFDEYKDFEESEHNIQTNSEDNKETQMLNQKQHLPSSSHNVKEDLEINIKTETVDSKYIFAVKEEPEDIGHLVFTTNHLMLLSQNQLTKKILFMMSIMMKKVQRYNAQK